MAPDPDDRPVACGAVVGGDRGGDRVPTELPNIPKKLSTLKMGLLRIWMVVVTHEPMPEGKIEHHNWPQCTWESDPLEEPYVHKG